MSRESQSGKYQSSGADKHGDDDENNAAPAERRADLSDACAATLSADLTLTANVVKALFL